MTATYSPKTIIGLLAGPALMLAILFSPPPALFSEPAWRLVAFTSWMVVWWMSEAVPVAVTALLPIPLMPLLDIAPQKTVAASYGHPLIFLFLGGFFIALAMQRSGLHRRIALNIVLLMGSRAEGIIAGFMIATAFLSMWISNTATTIMMYAVGLSVIEFVRRRVNDPLKSRQFGVALMLGIAYSASIGGVGTLVGTPPNVFLAGFLSSQYNLVIDFSTWLLIGLPIVLVMLPLAWLLLCRVVFPVKGIAIDGAENVLRDELAQMGKPSPAECWVLLVFIATACAWITRKYLVAWTGLELSDASIAMIAALLLFILPASPARGDFTLVWEDAKNIPWGVLLLFGGGLALAAAFGITGLAEGIGEYAKTLRALDISLMILLTIVTIVLLTEITSNIATTATFLPILGAVAVGFGVSPLALAIPVTLSASMAFMMPVATPPNAIVFSYQEMTMGDMIKAGVGLNMLAIATAYGASLVLVPWVFGL